MIRVYIVSLVVVGVTMAAPQFILGGPTGGLPGSLPGGLPGGIPRPPGSVGEEQAADAETQTLLNGVRGNVAQRLNRQELSEFTLLRYASQVVQGRNYFAKMRIGTNELGDAEYIHIRVYNVPWEDKLEL